MINVLKSYYLCCMLKKLIVETTWIMNSLCMNFDKHDITCTNNWGILDRTSNKINKRFLEKFISRCCSLFWKILSFLNLKWNWISSKKVMTTATATPPPPTTNNQPTNQQTKIDYSLHSLCMDSTKDTASKVLL